MSKSVIRAIALSSTYLVPLVAPAPVVHADPITAAIAGWLGGSAFATAVAGFLTNILASLAFSALSMLLAKKPGFDRGGLSTESTTTGEANPQKIILGRYATGGGSISPPYTWGIDNAHLVYVIAASHAPITGFDSFIIDGREYNTTALPVANPISAGLPLDGELNGRAWVKTYDGNQVAVNDYLLSMFGSHPERPWLPTSVLKGVAYSILTFYYDRELFSGFPEVRFIVRGMKLYDPRKDSSIGGSGSHRFGNPATYEFTNNPIVMAYNIMRGITLPDGLVYGLKVKNEFLPTAQWFAAMNACDEIVDGDQRYQAGIEISLDIPPLDSISELMNTCGGKIAEHGGYYNVNVGAPDAAIRHITDEDILISHSREESPFKGLNENFNSINGQYPDPANLWAETQAVPWQNDDWVIEDDGRILQTEIKLGAVPYPGQVRRLMRENLADHRRQRIHTVTLPPGFSGLVPLDTITWTSPGKGYSAKAWEVQQVSIDPQTLNVTVNLKERDPSDYNADAVSDAIRPVYPSRVSPPPVITGVNGFVASYVSITDNAGNNRRPAIRIQWTPNSTMRGVSYEITTTTGVVVDKGDVQDVAEGYVVISQSILPNTNYRVYVKPLMPGYQTEWSSYATVLTGNAVLTNDDFGSGGVGGALTSGGYVAVLRVASLPAVGTLNQIIFNTSNGKHYKWNGSAWVELIKGEIEGALDHTSFASTVSVPRIVTTLPTTGSLGQFVTLQSDGKLYRWNGTAFVSAIPAGDISGQLVAAQLANTAIQARHLAQNAVTGNAIANAAVSGVHLVANTLVASHFTAGAIGTREMAAGSVVASTLAVADFTNQVGDSEVVDKDAWISNVPAAFTFRNTPYAQILSKGETVYVPANNPTNANVYLFPRNDIPVQPGQEYFISTQMRRLNGTTARHLFQVLTYDASGTQVSNQILGQVNGAGLSWDAYSASYVIPASARTMRFRWFVYGAETDGNVVFAAPVIRLKNAGNMIVDGTLTGNHIAANSIGTNHLLASSITTAILAAGAVGADQVAANSISVRHLVVANVRNMVPNGNMNDIGIANDYWGASSAGSNRQFLSKITNAAFSETGIGSFLLQKHSNNITGAASVQMLPQFDIPVEAGKQYYGETSLRSNSGASAAGAFVRVNWLDNTKATISFSDIAGAAPISLTWTTHSASLLAPVGAAYARILVVNGAASTSQNMLVDRIILKERDGASLIVDGTITGQHIAASTITSDMMNVGWLSGERLSASYLDVNSLLSIGSNAGLRYQKPSVTADSVDGLYFGYDGSRFGFAASRTNAGKRQSIKLSSSTGLQMLNARFFVSGVTVPTTVDRTTNLAKTALPANIKEISFDMMGGGGGGASAVRSGNPTPGATGLNTIVRLYDGATLKQTLIAPGAAGAVDRALRSHESARIGSVWGLAYGAGGQGGAGSASSGGDSSQTTFFYGWRGSTANLISVDAIDVSTWASPQIEIVIGQGGSGGGGAPVNGGAGSPGRVQYSYSTVKDIPADVIPLEPTAVGSFITHASGAGSFPDLGAGYWMIHRNTATDGVGLGYVTVAPNSILRMYESGVVSFVSSQTPTFTSGLGNRQVWYSFHAMGNWG